MSKARQRGGQALRPLSVICTVAGALALLGCPRGPAAAPRPLPTGAPAGHGGLSGVLTIFLAGSLAVPFRDVSALFQKQHPGVTVQAEAAGSRDSARKITDLKRACDVFGSADDNVIKTLLMPEYADWDVRFATNEMAIGYTDKSRAAGEITAKNWPQVLERPEVVVGRSDPERDPCGYQTMMTLQLAEKFYHLPGLAQKIEAKGGERFIRPKETDLLALLESGEVDYIFIYRSVCVQHGLKFVGLPPEVNLGKPELADQYKTVSVRLTGKKPGEFLTLTGGTMVYSVTIPKSAPNRPAAEAWVALLLSPAGREIMKKNGQPAFAPALTDQFDRLPAVLQPLCARGK
jgi:molybdate/tungstate transport system substrate-binding protein